MPIRQLAAKLSPRGWAMIGVSAAVGVVFLLIVFQMASAPSYCDPDDRSGPRPDRQDHEHAGHQGNLLPAAEQRHRARGPVRQDSAGPRRAGNRRSARTALSSRASRCSTSSSSARATSSSRSPTSGRSRASSRRRSRASRACPRRRCSSCFPIPRPSCSPTTPAVDRRRAPFRIDLARPVRRQGDRATGRIERAEPAHGQGDDHGLHGSAAVADRRLDRVPVARRCSPNSRRRRSTTLRWRRR